MGITVDKEFEALIPPLAAEEFAQLEENCVRDGIRDPLIVWPQEDGSDILIDGHNRFKISAKHCGLPFSIKRMTFESREDAKIWIIQNQIGRRNLNTYNRSVLALELKPLIEKKARERQGTRTDKGNIVQKSARSRDELAAIAGVSHDTIHKVEAIEKVADPELKKQVRAGDVSVNQAYEKIKQKRKEERREAKRKAKEFSVPKELPDTCELFVADVESGIERVPKNSVDFIITDPPYPKEYIYLYECLSDLAADVLKDGGSLLVMCGQSYLPEVIEKLCTSMTYHWTLCYLTPGGQSPSLWQKSTNTFWKPIIWMTKGKYKGDYIGDVIKTDVNSNDKRFHEWGQSENGMASIIEKFTYPGDVIMDPFLGGGTTGVCAVSMGRRFIGCDINEECVSKSRERIINSLNGSQE